MGPSFVLLIKYLQQFVCFRVLAYTQIGTFILVLMSASWLLSTFLFPALLSIWGPVTRGEAGAWSCSTR